jgi:hypothetical protein
VLFPNNGPITGTNITRLTSSTFNLQAIGTYLLEFQISITETGQLCVKINNLEQRYTTVGRATGTCQFVGICIINTVTANTVISIVNPATASTALTITPVAGGPEVVSAHLVVIQIA